MTSVLAELRPLPTNNETLIRRADLPAYIGVSEQTLARWAHEGQGPQFIKLGARLVAYRADDIRDWLNSQIRRNTITPDPVHASRHHR
ncbi:MAG: AlpA family transcriptional regulator [Fimbriimonadaceae bacterium]|nr:AlpA family transcriptional regulator [Alphaproteobacteria bacterium]